MKNKPTDSAKAADSAAAQVTDATLQDPTIGHHVERLHKAAKIAKRPQRHIIAAGNLGDGVTGQRVLTVNTDGSHSVTVEPLSE